VWRSEGRQWVWWVRWTEEGCAGCVHWGCSRVLWYEGVSGGSDSTASGRGTQCGVLEHGVHIDGWWVQSRLVGWCRTVDDVGPSVSSAYHRWMLVRSGVMFVGALFMWHWRRRYYPAGDGERRRRGVQCVPRIRQGAVWYRLRPDGTPCGVTIVVVCWSLLRISDVCDDDDGADGL
jgi:hypothetical protein